MYGFNHYLLQVFVYMINDSHICKGGLSYVCEVFLTLQAVHKAFFGVTSKPNESKLGDRMCTVRTSTARFYRCNQSQLKLKTEPKFIDNLICSQQGNVWSNFQIIYHSKHKSSCWHERACFRSGGSGPQFMPAVEL